MGLLSFIPIVGDVVEGVASAKAARRQRRFQSDQAAQAHQTEVKDLRAAGLNPILSGTGGAGASAMSGSVAQVPNVSETMSTAIQNAKQRQLLDAQIENVRTDTGKKGAETAETVIRTQGEALRQEKERAGQPYWEGQAKVALNKAIADLEAVDWANRSSGLSWKEQTSRVTRILRDPKLQDFIMSAPYAEQKIFERIIEGDASGGDFARALQFLKSLTK